MTSLSKIMVMGLLECDIIVGTINMREENTAGKLRYRDIVGLIRSRHKGMNGVATAAETLASTSGLNRIVIKFPFRPPIVIINHPADVDALWRANQADLDKRGSLYDTIRDIYGHGHVFSQRGPFQGYLKSITAPYLRPSKIDGFEERTAQISEDTVDHILGTTVEGPATVDIHRAMKTASAHISTNLLFGMNFSIPLTERLIDAVTVINDYFVNNAVSSRVSEKVRRKVPFAYRRVTQASDILHATVEQVLDEGNSPLTNSLRAHGPDGDGKLTREDQLGEIANLLIARYSSVGNAITWSIYFLSLPENQALKKKIIAEHAARNDGNDSKVTAKRIFNEALRLNPPIYFISRKATADIDVDSEIGNMSLPKGSTVIFSPYLLQRNPQLWERPTEFDPDRFENPPARNTFLPFGYGERTCTGIQFACQVGTQVLEHLALKYNFSLDSSDNSTPVFLTTMTPRKVKLRIEKRSVEELAL